MSNNHAWSKLDNAGKIFPPTVSKRDTKVFRFVCELTEPVDGDLLKEALVATLERFPLYRSVLKKGLFWYYFEESDLPITVTEEQEAPCAPLYMGDRHGLLFRVNYYRTRINLEVFHALADGTGALQFLRTLVFYYLQKRYPQLQDDSLRLNPEEPSVEQKTLDAFYKYYEKERKAKPAPKDKAHRLQGARLPDERLGIIEGTLSAKAALEKAHEYDATLSEFLVALLLLAVNDGMAVRHKNRPVVITVPVDLRRFFPAQTARNFFGVVQIGYNFSQGEATMDAVIQSVKTSFANRITKENMLGIINKFSDIENNLLVKAVPLMVKIPALKLAGWWAEKDDTMAFSNIGRIRMPEAMAPYIRLFSVFLSTKRPQVCLCSYEDALSISFSSPLLSTDVQRSFFRRLVDMGLAVTIASNLDTPNEKEDAHADM